MRAEESYYNFLCDLIHGVGYVKYSKLLHFLYSVEYVWDPRIETDGNRADDGIQLRFRFRDSTGISIPRMPCTLLEMMIALSCRLEADLFGEPGDDHPEKWFWIMVNNLGLIYMDDDHFDSVKASDIVGKMLSRDIGKLGEGGLFPLKKSRSGMGYRDQRKEPIWEQLNSFLRENNLF